MVELENNKGALALHAEGMGIVIRSVGDGAYTLIITTDVGKQDVAAGPINNIWAQALKIEEETGLRLQRVQMTHQQETCMVDQ